MRTEKARVTVYNRVNVEVEYTVFMPKFLACPLSVSPPESRLERRATDFRRQALYLAQTNHGRSPVELAKPVNTHEELLKSLSCILGLIRLRQEEPYSVSLTIGGLFDAQEVAEKVTRLLFHHFYPEREVTWLEPVQVKQDQSCF